MERPKEWMEAFNNNIKYSKYHHADRETLDIYRDARETGTAPGTTCKLQFLGDGGAGKTSLIKKLLGRKFDPDIESTIGIETNMSTVSSVEANSWQEKGSSTASDEFIEKLSWFFRKSLNKKKANENSRVTNLKLPCCTIALGVFLFVSGQILGPIILTTTLTAVAATSYLAVRNWSFFKIALSTSFCLMFTYYCNYVCELLPYVTDISGGTCAVFGFVGICYGLLMGSGLLSSFAVIWCLITPIKRLLDENSYSMASCLSEEVRHSYAQHYFPQIGVTIRLVIIHGSSMLLNKQENIGPIKRRLVMSSLPFIIYKIYTVSPVSLQSPLLGIFFGFGIDAGVHLGRKVLSFMLSNLHPWQYVFGIASIFILGIINNFTSIAIFQYLSDVRDRTVPAIFIIRLMTIALVVAVESLELCSTIFNPKPFQDVYKTIGQKDDLEHVPEDIELSKSFHLWDFAGQYFYYNTHQTFIAKHAVCLLVFNLTWFAESKNQFIAFARIKFWLQSILSHTKGPIFLVGTHLDQVNKQQVELLQEFFEKNLRSYQRKFDFRIKQNGDNPFFTVDNTNSNRDSDDVRSLQTALKIAASELPPMKTEHPIRWWQFLIYVNEKREEATQNISKRASLITDIATLRIAFPTVQLAELINILQYFHDIGEIIYNERKQIIGLDPQFLIDAMYTLTTSKSVRDEGILYPQHIKSLLTDADDIFIERILSLLESKDLICKVTDKNDNKDLPLYLVPFLLPEGYPLVPRGTKWDQRFYIDFGEYNPHAVLSRLMARCISDSSTTEYKKGLIYRQGGLFTLSDDITYMITSLNLSPEQHLLEVSVKTLPEASSVPLLQYLCNIMKELHQHDFPHISYTCGVKCPHMAPHYGCPANNPHYFHVIPLASNKSPDAEFVEGDRLRMLCINREVGIHLGVSGCMPIVTR